MACYHCGKGKLYGRSHTHHRGVAGGRWKKRAPKTQRIFESNLQRMSIMENGEGKRVDLCTKCLKRVKKDIKDGVRPFVVLSDRRENKAAKAKIKETKPKKSTKKISK